MEGFGLCALNKTSSPLTCTHMEDTRASHLPLIDMSCRSLLEYALCRQNLKVKIDSSGYAVLSKETTPGGGGDET
jgi:hypothetical protein